MHLKHSATPCTGAAYRPCFRSTVVNVARPLKEGGAGRRLLKQGRRWHLIFLRLGFCVWWLPEVFPPLHQISFELFPPRPVQLIAEFSVHVHLSPAIPSPF